MKFIRRHDLTPHTRLEMVRLAWLHQGIYGKMTQIAQEYHISRTFLYQLIWAANLQLETLFSDQKPHVEDPHPLFEPFILLLRLEGKCSIPSLSSILKYFQYQPNSVGYLSECFHTLRCCAAVDPVDGSAQSGVLSRAMRFLPAISPSWSRLMRKARPF